MPELDRVGAVMVLVQDLLHHRRVDVGVAGAVEAEDDFVPVVDGTELGRRREDVEQVGDLVVGEGVHLGAADGDLDAGVEVGLELRPGHLREGAVSETCGDALHLGPPKPARRGSCLSYSHN